MIVCAWKVPKINLNEQNEMNENHLDESNLIDADWICMICEWATKSEREFEQMAHE